MTALAHVNHTDNGGQQTDKEHSIYVPAVPLAQHLVPRLQHFLATLNFLETVDSKKSLAKKLRLSCSLQLVYDRSVCDSMQCRGGSTLCTMTDGISLSANWIGQTGTKFLARKP